MTRFFTVLVLSGLLGCIVAGCGASETSYAPSPTPTTPLSTMPALPATIEYATIPSAQRTPWLTGPVSLAPVSEERGTAIVEDDGNRIWPAPNEAFTVQEMDFPRPDLGFTASPNGTFYWLRANEIRRWRNGVEENWYDHPYSSTYGVISNDHFVGILYGMPIAQGEDYNLLILNAETKNVVANFSLGQDWPSALCWGPNNTVFVGNYDGYVRQLDQWGNSLRSIEMPQTNPDWRSFANSLIVVDGQYLAAADGSTKSIAFFNLQTGSQLDQVIKTQGWPSALASVNNHTMLAVVEHDDELGINFIRWYDRLK